MATIGVTIAQFFCGAGRLLLELVEVGFSLDWYDFVMQVFDEDLAVVSPCILDGAWSLKQPSPGKLGLLDVWWDRRRHILCALCHLQPGMDCPSGFSYSASHATWCAYSRTWWWSHAEGWWAVAVVVRTDQHQCQTCHHHLRWVLGQGRRDWGVAYPGGAQLRCPRGQGAGWPSGAGSPGTAPYHLQCLWCAREHQRLAWSYDAHAAPGHRVTRRIVMYPIMAL